MIKPKKKKSELRRLIEKVLKKEIAPLGAKKILSAGDASDKYSKYFPDADYVTLDKRPGADMQADLHDLTDAMKKYGTVLRGKFDLILCISVLEHVEDPSRVVENLKKLLKPGGYLFVSVPFFYNYHHGGGYDDYWRFTKKGLEYIVGLDPVFIVGAENKSGFCGLFQNSKKAEKEILDSVETNGYQEEMEAVQG